MTTRSSTPKFEVIHSDTRTVVSPKMSMTDATKFARNMNHGCPKKRFEVRRAASLWVTDSTGLIDTNTVTGAMRA